MDPHTLSNYRDVSTSELELILDIDFNKKIIRGKANHQLELHNNRGWFKLDTSGLLIHKVTVDGVICQNYSLDHPVPFLGSVLSIPILNDSSEVSIEYETSSDSAGLQWLEPSQTEGKQHPMLYTQSQAILARTWIPCQDTPANKFTWEAQIRNNKQLTPVMSGKKKVGSDHMGAYHFRMTTPVPSYLVSMCIGNLEHKEITPQCGIYAEPEILNAAFTEFGDTPLILEQAAQLYGSYKWDRFDLLVLPGSFPFGGMENPLLTFLTPTLIAGDGSLINVVAHELAHSWSGNLVTNASWNDFWLNEGFTVYFERRIIESMEGAEMAALHAFLGYRELLEDLNELRNKPDATKLKLNLEGKDPDEGMTLVAYEKGYLLLCKLESVIGRPSWDQFMKDYFNDFAFRSLDTNEFIDYLLSKTEAIQRDEIRNILNEWIFNPGLPNSFVIPQSSLFDLVQNAINNFKGTGNIDSLTASNWNWMQTVLFLNGIDFNLASSQMEKIEDIFLTGNAEITFAWLKLVIRNNYVSAYPQIEEFLIKTGRRKFVEPLFKLLIKTQEGKTFALTIFEKVKNGYHSITRKSIEQILA